MVSDCSAKAGAKVAGDADFHRDLLPRQDSFEFGIPADGKSMPDAFGADVQRPPHRLRTAGLAGVRRQTQPLIGGFLVEILKPFRWPAAFVAADAHSHHIALTQ